MKIDLLVPTRKRVRRLLAEFLPSLKNTAKPYNVHLCLYRDLDDAETAEAEPQIKALWPDVQVVTGQPRMLTDTWNAMAKVTSGGIVCAGNDDMYFATPEWDMNIIRLAKECKDRILLLWCDDGISGRKVSVFPFVTRRVVELLGCLYHDFEAIYCDTWLHEVMTAVKRAAFIDGIKIFHNHPSKNPAWADETYLRDRALRKARDELRWVFGQADRDREKAVLHDAIRAFANGL
jgi:hypothetical protein